MRTFALVWLGAANVSTGTLVALAAQRFVEDWAAGALGGLVAFAGSLISREFANRWRDEP